MANNLCCKLHTVITCIGCEWESCWPCADSYRDKAPWDIHNEDFPECYMSKVERIHVGSRAHPDNPDIMQMCEVVF